MFKKMVRIFLKSDKLFILPLSFSLIGATSIMAFFLVLYNQLPNRLPLLYSLSWGETQMVEKQQFFMLPAITILIALLNAFIAWHIHPSQIVLKRILLVNLILVTLIALITTIKILTIFV